MSRIAVVLLFLCLFCMDNTTSSPTDQRYVKCYQCPNITAECLVNEASTVQCRGVDPHCTTRIKLEETNFVKAVRKCVSYDVTICPTGWNCMNCDTDYCNGASVNIPAIVVSFLATFLLITVR